MAQMIPEYFRSGTRGENILFNTLKGLPDDYVVYREPIIRNRRPDFVIIGPDIGFVVLEVKD
ncbi:MAG: NERD domain-containing protein, partial [Syntrophomonadaceae bacterium]|nr:NERD domain-containing protein [Syntrophomonadaceae bacterium]